MFYSILLWFMCLYLLIVYTVFYNEIWAEGQMLVTKNDFLEPSHAQRSSARYRKVGIGTRQKLGEYIQDKCEIPRY